jgi:hypothetical protein
MLGSHDSITPFAQNLTSPLLASWVDSPIPSLREHWRTMMHRWLYVGFLAMAACSSPAPVGYTDAAWSDVSTRGDIVSTKTDSRRDGTVSLSWKPMLQANALIAGTSLYGIWGSGPNDVFAVGGTILHYDGTSWSAMASGTSAVLLGVWGSSSTNVFAVGAGGGGVSVPPNVKVILHYDGTSWSAMTVPPGPGTFGGLWGSSATDVFAVGTKCSQDVCSGTIAHFDGNSWSTMSDPDDLIADNNPSAVWGTGPKDVFAVGLHSTVLHYDGVTWRIVKTGNSYALKAVWGSSGADVFAVRSINVGDQVSPIFHYNGLSWSEMSAPPGSPPGSQGFHGLWGSSAANVFAVGLVGVNSDASAIAHYDGKSWTTAMISAGVGLYAIWGSGPKDVFAVGTQVLHLGF